MAEISFYLYLVNSILLINHEIDSAYWKEWNMFKIPGGISVFLLLHFPLLFFILYGLVLVFQNSFSGLIFSIILSICGLFAFVIHMFFIKNGRAEFKTPMSIFILVSALVVSIVQFAYTFFLLV